jgi:hypothetical protein
MTHVELVARAARWLRTQGCPIVFAELVTTAGESPDAIGWRRSSCLALAFCCWRWTFCSGTPSGWCLLSFKASFSSFPIPICRGSQ